MTTKIDDIPVPTPVLDRAMELWREREMQFPERVRRMKPDEIDYASGAWAGCVIRAAEELTRRSDQQQARES